MMSRDVARSKSSKDPNTGKLLNEVETINKAFYLDKNPSKSSSSLARNKSTSVDKANVSNLKLKHVSDDLATKDKKSFWNWKPLKALSQVRHRRFNCCFTLEVQSIEGLPSKFDNVGVSVHWKRRDGEVVSNPVKVNRGVAKFSEKLTHTCSIYGSRNGPHHSAKYDAKHFLLYAEVYGNPKLDLGKHRVDLTRLLPLTLEELEDEKSSGTWTTSYKLTGEAKGALMNVSFGYLVLGDSTAPIDKNVLPVMDSKATHKSLVKSNQGDGKGIIRRSGSLPANQKSSMTSKSVDDIKILHEVPPTRMSEFSNSVNILFQKFDEEKVELPVDVKHEIEIPADDSEPIKQSDIVNECEDAELLCAGQGQELEEKVEREEGNILDDQVEKSLEHTGIYDDVGKTFHEDDNTINTEENDACAKKSLLEDLESILSHVAELEKEGMDTPEVRSESSDQEISNRDKSREMMPSHSFEDLADTVTDEFLSMLEVGESSVSFHSDVESESPRERLLREFQMEAEASGCSLFGFDIDEDNVEDYAEDYAEDYDDYAPTISGWEEFSEDFDSFPVDELEYPKVRARMMENLETQALMEEWGMNEKAFECSPPHNIDGFGSPIDLPPNEPSLPPLGEGLGSFVQTKTGGFLRSMNPVLFRNAKSGGSLIMQVSSPVVVPAELGSGIMDVLQQLASAGLEKLSVQANKFMPLEDITGKTMQQMAWEVEASKRHVRPDGEKRVKGASSSRKSKKSSSSSARDEVDSEYVSLEDLAPLAMDKIEALSIEGLRIQSGMSDEEAPSNITAQSIGEVSALEGKRASSVSSMGLEGSAGLQLLNLKDNGTDYKDGDGLMGLSLTLDEWIKLDSGEIDEDQPSERTTKLLAAHHASSTDLNFLGSKQGKAYGKRCGFLGNNFNVALMVQLRDPSRDYEPVGVPMLALIQVERVFVPPKPRVYRSVAKAIDDNGEDDELESAPKEETKLELKEEKTVEKDLVPQFKINEVNVVGMKAEPGKKRLWGNAAQQQSGSRWLLANGMGKGKKNPLPVMKPKITTKTPLPGTITSQPGDTLWSISARYNGSGAKWKELAALNPHIRNPNVILSNEIVKLR
ncbi:protein PLASTID MOVEMENT IMPAIRED 1-RELATED 1 [Silene latifolia]|uniref:protein PLASTID MOVEMENT IMPAIRED 1-RELATED 1 n=1 Tax=Silene latifolia TaxID=37657 RepID=UPI003D77C00C